MGSAAIGESRTPPPEGDDAVLRDPARLGAVRALGLGRGDRAAFDPVARLVARATGAPTAIVSLVGAERQSLIGRSGLVSRLLPTREIPTAASLCRRVVATGDLVRVDDLGDDDSGLALGIRAYIGAPVRDAAGNCLGAVCAADAEPRGWTDEDAETVRDAAAAVAADLARATGQGAGAEAGGAALLAASHDGVLTIDGDGRVADVNERLCAMTGLDRASLLGAGPVLPFWSGEDAARATGVLAAARAGRPDAADVTLVRADGSTTLVAMSARPDGPR